MCFVQPTNEAFLRVLAPAAVEELMSSTDESDINALSLMIQGWTVPSPLLNAVLSTVSNRSMCCVELWFELFAGIYHNTCMCGCNLQAAKVLATV